MESVVVEDSSAAIPPPPSIPPSSVAEQPQPTTGSEVKPENAMDTGTTEGAKNTAEGTSDDVKPTSEAAAAEVELPAGTPTPTPTPTEAETKPKEEEPKKPLTNTTLISCANCNCKIQEVELQIGRDVEIDRLLNETLLTPLTMEVCDDEQENDKITATVEITVFEALIEIFSLRTKSPHLVPLLERVMKKNSVENASTLDLGAKHGKAPQQMKLLSLCDDCIGRIANLYELYKEFTLLSMKSNAFFSRIVASSSSGSFSKSNIKTVPVPRPQPPKQHGNDDTPQIPEVFIEEDEESMDYSANQTYSDDNDDVDGTSYTMDVETVYGESPIKITNSRGRAITDHSTRGSGMYNDSTGTKRGEKKRKCHRCGKIYFYSTSYEKHLQSCRGPVDVTPSPATTKFKVTYSSDDGDDVSILPDDMEHDNHHNNSGSSFKARTFPASSQPQVLKVFQCKFCSKICQSTGNLQRHERTHGSPSTTCKPCARTFGSVYDLRRHYQTNTHKQRIREGAEPNENEGIDGDPQYWNYNYAA